MSYTDCFRSWGESVRPSTIDSAGPGKNASEPVRRMPESDPHPQRHGRLPGATINPRPRLPMGEIVEVEGGHIVRSTGRKDRHSKVYTAKGPRDRRVRLSASTAIQFYDLQDRLGYDRPSKAVAWLIEKAKASIDELDRLPEIRPPLNNKYQDQDQDQETEAQSVATASASFRDEHSRSLARERARERAKERAQEREAVAKAAAVDNNTNNSNNSNNIQFSFFNLYNDATNINATHSLIQALQLQNSAPPKSFPPAPHSSAPFIDINPSDSSMSRNPMELQASQLQQQNQTFYQPLHNFSSSQFETPAVVFCEAENSRNHHQTHQGLFTGSAYQAISEHHNEFSNHHSPQTILRATTYPWTNTAMSSFSPFGSLNVGGNGPQQQHHHHQQNSFAIRGTLQSSSSPVRVRPMPLAHDLTATDHLLHHHHHTTAAVSIPPLAGGGGFSSFRIPARIQGIDELDDVKPSAASSTSQM